MNTKRRELTILIVLFLTSSLYAGEFLRFGAGLGWDGTVSRGLRETEGWQGEAALTLSPLGRNPFLSQATTLEGEISADDIDLLLLAEAEGMENPVGNYQVTGLYEISEQFAARGDVSIRPGQEGLSIHPTSRSMWAPGSEWGDFTIDFRLRPATLRNGEIFFSWQGRDEKGNPQSILARVENRRLVWDFRSFFRLGSDRALSLRLTSPPLIPGEWRHHRIRFNRGISGPGPSGASPGLLEYLVDGIPSDMVHTTRDGREGPEPYSPRIGSLSDEALHIAPSLSGYFDEFRIARAYAASPPAGGYANTETAASGSGRTEAVDSLYPGSALSRVRARVDTPGNTQVRFFARSMQHQEEISLLGMPSPGNPDWIALKMEQETEDPTGFGRWYSWKAEEKLVGRYFAVAYILEPDPGADLAPVLSALEMEYDPRLPPKPPRDLRWERGDDGRVRISWSPDAEENVAGWWISWGPRPGDYASLGDDSSVRGRAWIPRLAGRGNSRPEFIWPESQSGQLIYTSLRTAWIEGAPVSGSDSPGDYRALSPPTGEMNFRP